MSELFGLPLFKAWVGIFAVGGHHISRALPLPSLDGYPQEVPSSSEKETLGILKKDPFNFSTTVLVYQALFLFFCFFLDEIPGVGVGSFYIINNELAAEAHVLIDFMSCFHFLPYNIT